MGMGPTITLFGLLMILAAVDVDGRSIPQKSKRNLYPPVAPTLDNMPGIPGKDYPTFSHVPVTAFHCSNPGYYADVDTNCQVFHVCQVDGRHDRFMCPNGTLFNQEFFICDWWYNVQCSAAPTMFYMNHIFHPYPETIEQHTSKPEITKSEQSHPYEAVKPNRPSSDQISNYERNDYEIRYSGARLTPPPSDRFRNYANREDETRFLDNRGQLNADDGRRQNNEPIYPVKTAAANFPATTPANAINYTETYDPNVGSYRNQIATPRAGEKHETGQGAVGDVIKPDVIEKVTLETDGKFIETIGPESIATFAVGQKVSQQEVAVDEKTYKEEAATVQSTEQTEQPKHATYESDSGDRKSSNVHSAEAAQVLHQTSQPSRKQRLRKVVIKRPLTKTKNAAYIESTSTAPTPTTTTAAPLPTKSQELESEAEVIEGRSLIFRPEKASITTDLPSTTITTVDSTDTVTAFAPEILEDTIKDFTSTTTTEVSTSEPDAEFVSTAVLNNPISVTLLEETSRSSTESVPESILQVDTEALQVQGRINSVDVTESTSISAATEMTEAGPATATSHLVENENGPLLVNTNQALLEDSTQPSTEVVEPNFLRPRILSEAPVLTEATTISIQEEKLLEPTTDTADLTSMSRSESFSTEAALEAETGSTNAVNEDAGDPQITTEFFGSNNVFVGGFGLNSQQEPVPDKQLIKEQQDSSSGELEAAFIGAVRNLEGHNSLRAGFMANSPVAADVVRTTIELERDSKSFQFSDRENSQEGSIDTSLNEDQPASSTLPSPLQLGTTETVVQSTLSSVDPLLIKLNLSNQVAPARQIPSEESVTEQTVTDHSTDPALGDPLDDAVDAKQQVDSQPLPSLDSATEIPDSRVTDLPEDNSVPESTTIPLAAELRQKTSASLKESGTSGASSEEATKRSQDEQPEKEMESTANNRLAKSITVPVAVFFKLPLSAGKSQLIRK